MVTTQKDTTETLLSPDAQEEQCGEEAVGDVLQRNH